MIDLPDNAVDLVRVRDGDVVGFPHNVWTASRPGRIVFVPSGGPLRGGDQQRAEAEPVVVPACEHCQRDADLVGRPEADAKLVDEIEALRVKLVEAEQRADNLAQSVSVLMVAAWVPRDERSVEGLPELWSDRAEALEAELAASFAQSPPPSVEQVLAALGYEAPDPVTGVWWHRSGIGACCEHEAAVNGLAPLGILPTDPEGDGGS